MIRPVTQYRTWTRLSLATLGLLLAPALPAQETEGQEEGSRYAHVRHVEGRATMVRAYDGESVLLSLNLPVVPGDRIEADAEALLEVRLAEGSFLRARGPLRLDVHALASAQSGEEEITRLELQQGDLSVELVGMEDGTERTVQVDTPSSTAYLMTDGLYRIRAEAGSLAIVWVRDGVAEVEAEGSTVLLRGGQSTRIAPGQEPSEPGARITRLDDFERWVDGRRDEAGGAPLDEEIAEDLPEPVRPYAGDLSRHGRWERLPTYGTVWVPGGVDPGWFPYYNGYWVGAPTGTVWVSYEPWGWAPYHYGRWHWVAGYGWVWIPGWRFAGAWVSWWVGPSYVAWVPLGYYDAPAVDLRLVFSSVRAPRTGWACVPYPLFYSRDLPRRLIRDPRVLRVHLDHAVRVRRLPDFHPRDLRVRPDIGNEVFSTARRVADEPRVRRFHAAEQRLRPSVRARAAAALAQKAGSPASRPPIRTPALHRRVDSGPLREPARARGQAPAGPQAGSVRPTPRAGGHPRSVTRTDAPRSERGIRELLHRVARPAPPAPRADSPAVRPAPPRVREGAHPRATTPRTAPPRREPPSKPSAPRGSSGSSKSHPRGSKPR